MKAAMITADKKIEIVQIDAPKADGYKVLMKPTAVGICGSDVHFWQVGSGAMYNSTVPGHEHAGVVADPGCRTDLKVGDRITTIPLTTYCGRCEACLRGDFDNCTAKIPAPGNYPQEAARGSYADLMAAAPHLVVKLPDTMSDEEAAMIEPASTPYSACKQLGISRGATVLVSGGGIIGSCAAQWAKYFGAKYVAMTEVNEFRGNKVKADGYIDELFDGKDEKIVEKLRVATGGKGFDYFIECSGNINGTNTGLAAMKMRGKVALIGVQLQPKPFSIFHTMLYRLTVIGILGYTAPEFKEVMQIIANKEFNVLKQYSRDIKLEEVQQAFEDLENPNGTDIKIMIKFDK
ncbi:MAG: zinc-binding dehydrogenase [Clostridia bacterium]|nr:zinc-binding dehydrogenase [Clostridia bacterium]